MLLKSPKQPALNGVIAWSIGRGVGWLPATFFIVRDQRWFRGVIIFPLIHSHSHPINPFSIHEITVYSFSYFHFTFSFCVHLIHSPEISVLNVYFSAQDQNFITEWCWRWVGWSDFLQADRQRAKQRRGKNSLKAGPHKKHPHFVGKGAQKAASRSLTVALTVVTAAAAHSGRVLGQRRSLRPWFPTNPHKTRSKRNNPSPPKS